MRGDFDKNSDLDFLVMLPRVADPDGDSADVLIQKADQDLERVKRESSWT